MTAKNSPFKIFFKAGLHKKGVVAVLKNNPFGKLI